MKLLLCGFALLKLKMKGELQMETPLIKIGDTVINMDNVACIKEDGGNLEIDFVSGRADHVQRIKLSGIEAARFSAYLTSVVHELGIEGP